jgi:hypothetical protein
MRLDEQHLQFLANHLAVEERFGTTIPPRLRNAFALRDFTAIEEVSRVQISNHLAAAGYLSQQKERRLERGFRTSLTEAGKKVIARTGTTSNLSEDEIDANIRAFGFQPMDGARNGQMACSIYTPKTWESIDGTKSTPPNGDPAAPNVDDDPMPSALTARERQELLEDLRAELAKESDELDKTRSELATMDADIPLLRRRTRFLTTLLARYNGAATNASNGGTRAGIEREAQRVRDDLRETSASLATMDESEYAALKTDAAVLEAIVEAIREAIAEIEGVETGAARE